MTLRVSCSFTSENKEKNIINYVLHKSKVKCQGIKNTNNNLVKRHIKYLPYKTLFCSQILSKNINVSWV